jgi:hypothetical protein
MAKSRDETSPASAAQWAAVLKTPSITKIMTIGIAAKIAETYTFPRGV